MAKLISVQKEWMSLKTIATEYADLGESTLRRFLGHPTHPLPAKEVGGKVLVHRLDFDKWLRSFPNYATDTDRLVDGIMADLNGKTHT